MPHRVRCDLSEADTPLAEIRPAALACYPTSSTIPWPIPKDPWPKATHSGRPAGALCAGRQREMLRV
ncbi:conserved hypothetical protein [Ricinus communis]|uniref:Uncharacterized protein n=1 Tax=Ricinus communis TaxID=3988 RepID=B9TD01_RICCO|nr:conserved hypothetical protein [Ricinus communis]